MNLTLLEITRKEYINIVNHRVLDESPNISTNKLLKKVKCLKKKGLKHLASIRNVSISDDMSTEEILNTIALKRFSKIKDHVDPHKSISRLFYKKTSSNTGRDYYCLSCLKSFQTGMS